MEGNCVLGKAIKGYSVSKSAKNGYYILKKDPNITKDGNRFLWRATDNYCVPEMIANETVDVNCVLQKTINSYCVSKNPRKGCNIDILKDVPTVLDLKERN